MQDMVAPNKKVCIKHSTVPNLLTAGLIANIFTLTMKS